MVCSKDDTTATKRVKSVRVGSNIYITFAVKRWWTGNLPEPVGLTENTFSTHLEFSKISAVSS